MADGLHQWAVHYAVEVSGAYLPAVNLQKGVIDILNFLSVAHFCKPQHRKQLRQRGEDGAHGGQGSLITQQQ
ncbi:hypothetical protein D3C79_761860 [compost metagenome]